MGTGMRRVPGIAAQLTAAVVTVAALGGVGA
jgi:hypothetical protein